MDEPRLPRRPVRKPSAWSPRPIPQPVPERRTADPVTPTLKELAARESQRASLVAAPTAALAAAAPPQAVTRGPAVGSPIRDVSQCAGAWHKVSQNAEWVLARGIDPRTGTTDVLRRNTAITAAYAQLYEEDSRLRWAGVAAFASKQVGCGLRDARAIAQAPASELERLPPINVPVAAGQTAMEARRWAAQYMEGALGRGNEAVFRDIYPVHRFYEDNGLNALRLCQGQRPERRVPPQIVQAFGELDGEGQPPSEDDLRTAAKRILRHEQRVTLQSAVYDDSTTAALLLGNQAAYKVGEATRYVGGDRIVRAAGVRPVEVAFTPECEGYPSERFEALNLADFQQRWPYAQQVANRFHDMVHGSGNAQIQHGLQALAGRGGR